jgi:uncharacterized integral membrane protein
MADRASVAASGTTETRTHDRHIRRWVSFAAIAALFVILVIFIAQNFNDVTVKLLWTDATMKLAWALIGTAVIGYLMGVISGYRWRR